MNFPTPATSLATWTIPERNNGVSLDFEFDRYDNPTLLGLSAGGNCVSVEWDWRAAAKVKELINSGHKIIGHNLVDADRPLIIKHAGIVLPLDQCEDTIVQHMLANSYFQNVGNKRKGDNDEGEGDARGIGMLDLWSFVGLYTDLPNWKKCRDGLKWFDYPDVPRYCDGPCPVHRRKWYNAVDAYGPDVALPALHADLEHKRVPRRLIEQVQEYCEVAQKMRVQGLRVDLQYRDELNKEFQEERAKFFPKISGYKPCGNCARMKSPPCKRCTDSGAHILDGLGQKEIHSTAGPFEPASPKQIEAYFRKHGVSLRTTGKDDLYTAIQNVSEASPAYPWLQALFAYKELGKGTDSWLADKYLTGEFLHPRTIPYGAASGRTAASRPNYQNFPKKRTGIFSKIRNCIIAFPGMVLCGADIGQMEYRGMLWYALVWLLGDEARWRREFRDTGELFTPMLPSFGDLLKRAAELSNRSERDVLKTVVYAALYNEGIQVRGGNDLELPRTRSAIEAGALVVHKDWECCGGLVCYTGVNLADRLFGGHSYAQRKLALEIQERFFSLSGGREIRLLHKKVADSAESGFISSHTGRYLRLVGTPGDRIKDGSAHLGQGLTDYVQEAILKYSRSGFVPYMMVHDELIFNRPQGQSDKYYKDFMDVMSEDSKLFEGFRAPIEVKVGERWGAMRKL